MTAATVTDAAPLETGWLPTTPIGDSLVRQFIFSQGAVNETLAVAKAGRVEGTAEVSLADANSSAAFLNQAVLRRPVIDDDDPVLEEIAAFYAQSGSPATLVSVWPTADLRAHGWELVGHPMLVVRAPSPAMPEPRPGVSVAIATGAADLAVAERVLIDGFPLTGAVGAPPGSELSPALLDSELVVRVGFLDGTPTGVGMSHVGHGLVNLCGGTTLPAARRRGVWEALVWSRVASSPEMPAVAFTSDDSRPGFIRMGFLPVTRLTMWALQGRHD